MSHSGSRGTGAQVANHYTKIAKTLRPEYGDLAWLDLGTPEGDEYWAAMNLMGEYASANHHVIHREGGFHMIEIAVGTCDYCHRPGDSTPPCMFPKRHEATPLALAEIRAVAARQHVCGLQLLRDSGEGTVVAQFNNLNLALTNGWTRFPASDFEIDGAPDL